MSGRWLIAGTPTSEPYPCRCAESRYGRCSPMWCPCAARQDPPEAKCCGHRTTVEDVQRAKREYAARTR